MNNILVEFINKDKARYETIGDYFDLDCGITVYPIVDLGNDDMNFLVLIHELIEDYLRRKRGVLEKDISEFDIMYEQERSDGKHEEIEEPGNDDRAPYKQCHQFAELFERILAHNLGVNWSDYEQKCIDIWKK